MRAPFAHEFLVYLEGIRVAFNSATISVQANQPATATVSIPPVNEAKGILPRTLVHIFYRDPDLAETGDETEVFRLLFEGEVTGIQFSKNARGSRSATLECMDLSNYWFYNYAFYYTGWNKANFGQVQNIFFADPNLGMQSVDTAEVKITSENVVIPDAAVGTNSIAKLLSTFNESGIIAGLQELFRLTQESNEFFRLANRRLRITDVLDPAPPRLTLPPATSSGQPVLGTTPEQNGTARRGKVIALKDPQSIFLYAGQLDPGARQASNEAWLAHFAGQFPSTFRITEIMGRIMNLFYYQYWPIPTAPAVAGDASETGDDRFRINSFIIKPTTWYTAPPACNVLFPDLYTTFTATRSFLSEPTRLLLRVPVGALGSFSGQLSFLAPAALQAAAEQIIGPLQVPKEPQVPSPDPKPKRTIDLGPNFLVRESDLTVNSDTPIGLIYRTLMASKALPPESREDIKGIIDRELQLPINAAAATLLTVEIDPRDPEKKANLDSLQSFSQYLTNIADFELLLAQHEPRTVSVTAPFNPYFTPGFPFAILDEVSPIIAEAGSVSWFISADGDASMTISGTYVRDRDVIKTLSFPTSEPLEDLDPTLIDAPFFFPFAYRPEIVGSKTPIEVTSHKVDENFRIVRNAGATEEVIGAYPQLFGQHLKDNGDKTTIKSVVQRYSADTPDSYKFLTFEALRLALRDNLAIEDEQIRANRAWEFVRRNVASLRQVFEYMNAKVVNVEQIINEGPDIEDAADDDIPGPFRREFRLAARAFRNAATPGRIGVTVGDEIGRGILVT